MSKRILTRRLVTLVVLLVLAALGVNVSQTGSVNLPPAVPSVPPGYYQVKSVSDGDTINVLIAGKSEPVRLIGIDTPEEKDPRKPVQCFAMAAAKHMEQLVSGKNVRLEGDPADTDRDKYHRLLRYVYLKDGTFVNRVQIEQGYGFAYTLFPFTKVDEFRADEADARTHNRGLWAGCQIHSEGEKKQTNNQ